MVLSEHYGIGGGDMDKGISDIFKYDEVYFEAWKYNHPPMALNSIIRRFMAHFRPMNGDKHLITITRVKE